MSSIFHNSWSLAQRPNFIFTGQVRTSKNKMDEHRRLVNIQSLPRTIFGTFATQKLSTPITMKVFQGMDSKNLIRQHSILKKISVSSKRSFSSASNSCVDHSDQMETLRKEYIHRGQWSEKEPMDVYLRNALEVCRKYVSTVELSSEEREQYQIIKTWYQQEYIPQDTTLLPFIKLEAIGKTFETSGGNYLKEKEISFYLKNGLVGPLSISSIDKSQLNAISERFPNFNKDYFRNLGSLYSALKNKCLLKLATNKEILAKVSSILGDNIMLCNMTVHEIGACSGKSSNETNGMVDAFNCHSDLSSGSHYYFRPGANQVENLALDNRGVCVWVSITGTDQYNSPLYVFPSTHHWEITTPFTHIESTKNNKANLDNVLKLLAFNHRNPARRMGLCNMEYEYLLSSQYKLLLQSIYRTEIYTKPGDVIMFNQHTRHGSGFNSSSKSRLAISLRFNTAFKEVGGIESAGAIVTKGERELLGLKHDKRKPIIQLLGKEHHHNNIPIDLTQLAKEAY